MSDEDDGDVCVCGGEIERFAVDHELDEVYYECTRCGR